MFNPIIIVAVLIQGFIGRANKMAGAIAGFLITTGILVWGLFVYSDGDQISFFGSPIDQGFFIILCKAWYGFDVYGLIKARKLSALDAENRLALAKSVGVTSYGRHGPTDVSSDGPRADS